MNFSVSNHSPSFGKVYNVRCTPEIMDKRIEKGISRKFKADILDYGNNKAGMDGNLPIITGQDKEDRDLFKDIISSSSLNEKEKDTAHCAVENFYLAQAQQLDLRI